MKDSFGGKRKWKKFSSDTFFRMMRFVPLYIVYFLICIFHSSWYLLSQAQVQLDWKGIRMRQIMLCLHGS